MTAAADTPSPDPVQRPRWVLTGRYGTLGPVVATVAEAHGIEVIGWPREQVPPEDAEAGERWLGAQRPDAILHLGMGSVGWAARLAAHAATRALPFVYTSTAMVFHHEPDGPHAVDAPRQPQDGYGPTKRDAEDGVAAAHPGACIARLGWQIDPEQPGNNMLMALDRWQAEQGRVAASRRWKPACSFMEDTALALLRLAQRRTAGVVHLDSNAGEGHAFFDIVLALKARFGRGHWAVVADDAYVHDQRLLGGEQLVPPLSSRLPALQGRTDG